MLPSNVQLFFLRKLVQQLSTNVTYSPLFPRADTLPFPPCPFSKKPTLPHSGKLPAVTNVFIFQTACKMTSHWCVISGPVSANKAIVYYSYIFIVFMFRWIMLNLPWDKQGCSKFARAQVKNSRIWTSQLFRICCGSLAAFVRTGPDQPTLLFLWFSLLFFNFLPANDNKPGLIIRQNGKL